MITQIDKNINVMNRYKKKTLYVHNISGLGNVQSIKLQNELPRSILCYLW